MGVDPETSRQYAYLRIKGCGPSSRITEAMGLSPDDEWSEGDIWRENGPPTHRRRQFTSWHLNSGLKDTEDLNTHVGALLQRLMFYKEALQSLSGDYDLCAVLVSHGDYCFGFELDFEHQRQLTHLRIRTWIDAYMTRDIHHMLFNLQSRFGKEVFDED